MTIDAFTAATLVAAASQGGDKEGVYDLYKEMKDKNDGGPTAEAIAFFKENEGKRCKVTGTSHEGIVHRLNNATAGFYPGSRCPIYVKITNGQSAGMVFEYGLDQVEVVE